ncbi:phage baseplate assembly protein V [Paenibacillus yanchengensis]|uniref:Phage baseplate assembly protein V n=1 Tax=Paenibacillus yanchengensis TaxID=2035833 RepID=A0ABW4YEP4_9BACL
MYESLNDRSSEVMGLVHGVYIGIVTDNKDEQNYGRVQVKVPIFDNNHILNWARVATLMAGSKQGTLFVPDVGDEVLIAFHMGDVRQPIVIGSLWSKTQVPPEGKDEKNNIRKITTRSGHQLIFDDSEGNEKITLQTKKGHVLELKDKQDELVLTDSSKVNVIQINGGSANEITVKSGKNTITVSNTGEVSIESLKSIRLKAAQIAVEATATLDLKASAALNLKSDGLITIKGSLVNIN